MLVQRRFPPALVLRFAAYYCLLGGGWAAIVFAVYEYGGLHFLRLPFLPIATVGTAVAFYVGFKNNSSYDRFWEGRKIWGGIVNSSRTWANFAVNYVDSTARGSEQALAMHRELLYRHLAWINALRLQLRSKSRFFDKPARATKRRMDAHAEAMRNDWDKEIAPFLEAEEHARISAFSNSATQLLVVQGQRLSELVEDERLDKFHQIEMMEVIEELYTLQGKCERIKNTPFPRQYAEYSRIFTRVFAVLVPFGMLDVFADQLARATTTAETLMPALPMIFASVLVTWVFMTMEAIGDASEDPFERSMNDVPMNALCRTIEIDLREMLGETDLPEKEQPIDGLLY